MNVKILNVDDSTFSSFFDDPKPIEKPWRSPLKHEDTLDPHKVVVKAYMNKRVKKSNNYKKWFFQFTPDFFCVTKVKKKN
jgi:hypothetical protein